VAAAADLRARLASAEAARDAAVAEAGDLKAMCGELMAEVERGLARGAGAGGVEGWGATA
jgi:hypothetical protein